MIDVTKILGEFRAADFRAYVQAYTLGDLVYRSYFPTQYTPFLTYQALEATEGAKVAADVVSFDARAPKKGRPTPAKISGDIPKIEVARDKNETQLNTYRQLVASISQFSSADTQNTVRRQIVEWMYNDGIFVQDAVNARMEWLAKRICSTGAYNLTIANNEAGIQTRIAVDFKIPGANVTNASTNYFAGGSTAATRTPITDIKAVEKAARAKGIILRYAVTDRETMDKILNSDETQKYVASWIANAINLLTTPTVASLNTALRSEGLPEFRVWDSFITIEGKDGSQVVESGWEQGRITFSTTPTLGQSQHTTTADEFVTIDESAKVKSDIVLVKAFALQDPITVVTKGVAYATPVLQNRNQIYILKTSF